MLYLTIYRRTHTRILINIIIKCIATNYTIYYYYTGFALLDWLHLDLSILFISFCFGVRDSDPETQTARLTKSVLFVW